MAILATYRPSNQATYAIIPLVHELSEKKRPPLPQRKSSAGSFAHLSLTSSTSAPDPEATTEDPQEKAIEKKLLQSFVTHVLEQYINSNELEWATRLQEHFEPAKIVKGRKSFGEAFREEPKLQEREVLLGQLVVSKFNNISLSPTNSAGSC
jgi:hypothetical protein